MLLWQKTFSASDLCSPPVRGDFGSSPAPAARVAGLWHRAGHRANRAAKELHRRPSLLTVPGTAVRVGKASAERADKDFAKISEQRQVLLMAEPGATVRRFICPQRGAVSPSWGM